MTARYGAFPFYAQIDRHEIIWAKVFVLAADTSFK